jgi:Flp pilus assembly protein TadD
MKLRPIPKLASNYQCDKQFVVNKTERNIFMKARILLYAGLLAISATITLDSNQVIAKDLDRNEHRLISKQVIAAEKNSEYYKRSCKAKYNAGDYSSAIIDCTRAIEIEPNNFGSYYNRGGAEFNLGQYEAAMNDYNQAIKLNPNDADSYSNRGVVKGKLGDRSAAMADYNRALQINPNHPDALYNLANAEAGLRRDQEQRALDQINRVNNAQTCCR